MAAVPMLRINVELELRKAAIGGALPCQLHITDNFTLGAGEEPMSEGRSDAAAVEVDDVSTPMTGEDDALIEGVAAVCIDQTETP